MKKKFTILIVLMAMLSYSTVAQIKVNSSGKVAIGSGDPSSSYLLTVHNGNTYLRGNLDLGNNTNFPFNHIKVMADILTIKAFLGSFPEYDVGSLGTATNQWGLIYGESIYADGEYLGSDLRLKENIINLDNSLEKIKLLRPVKFDFKSIPVPDLPEWSKYIIEQNNKRKNRTGFIAQEVLNVIPDIVEYDTTGDKYYLDYNAIIPYLVQAIQEQQQIIESLEYEINSLKFESSYNLKSELITNDDNLIEQNDIPILYQNKPNPFNEDTEISFYIPEKIIDAKLYIYNIQGNQLKSIVINKRNQGNEIIHGSNLLPGMYMYTLIVDGQEVDTKRIILTE